MKSSDTKEMIFAAVLQSAPALLPDNYVHAGTTLSEAELQGRLFMEGKDAYTLKEMRALPADVILERGSFRPITDGWFLTNKDTYKKIPIITGFTADDIRLYPEGINPDSITTEEMYIEAVGEALDCDALRFLELYPYPGEENIVQTLKEMARERSRINIQKWAADVSSNTGEDSYTYYFNRAIPWPEHPEYGAFHTSEVPYVFNNLYLLERPWSEIDRNIASTLAAYWVQFAATGNPNKQGLPTWIPVEQPKSLILEISEDINMVEPATDDELGFWLNRLEIN